MPWQSATLAKHVAAILAAVDAPPVDSKVRLALQRIYHRKEMFGGDGRGHVTLLLRTILESNGNEDALIEPIVSAVELAMRPEWTEKGLAWIESFYQITADRDIADDARPRSFQRADSAALPNVLRNKLFKIFATAKPAVKPLAKREPKPPAYLARVPGVERNVALGLELLKLRSAIQNNREYGQQLRRQFEIETKLAVDALKVARLYGARPEIFTRLSWNALVHLASPALPAATREALERRIPAGEHIGAPEIRAARGALKAGKRGRQADQRAQQMVA